MKENGDEKLIAVTRHIAKTLGHTDSMTDDILKIFNCFDGRLREKLSDDGIEQTLKSLHRRLYRHMSTHDSMWSNSADVSSFLASVDQLIAAVRDWTPLAGHKHVASCLTRPEVLLQQTMLRLENEFRTLLQFRCGSTFHPDYSDDDVSVVVDEEDDDEEETIPVAQPVTDYDIMIDAL